MEHTNHKRTTTAFGWFETIGDCPACKEKAEENNRVSVDREDYMQANTEDLICDNCGATIGRVYANDLNGSRFYCTNCL